MRGLHFSLPGFLRRPYFASAVVLTLLGALAACGRQAPESQEHVHGHAHEEHAGHSERGPHGGRLLAGGDVLVELAIFEAGVPPEFRAWVTRDGRALSPSDVFLEVRLSRLGGVTETIGFTPQGDFLRGNQEVVEPHSFDVHVTARVGGQSHEWTYESYEGRTVIPEAVARDAGVETAIAGPGTLTETLTLYGSIVPDPTRTREVRARFPGLVQGVSKRVGDTVRAGETLARIESNESLRAYDVTAPIAGVITARRAEPGEQTSDRPLFEIADYSRVWAELKVFPRDRGRLSTGQRVQVRSEGTPGGAAKIDYVAPSPDRTTPGVIARVTLDNASGSWTPGQFVEGVVTVNETRVDLAVPLSALQTFRDWDVVFAQVEDTYEVRPVELGRRDAMSAEVLGGLAPGTRYVTRNSFLIKADIEKSGASHDH